VTALRTGTSILAGDTKRRTEAAMSYPTPPGAGDQSPPPDPQIQAYQPPPDPIYQPPGATYPPAYQPYAPHGGLPYGPPPDQPYPYGYGDPYAYSPYPPAVRPTDSLAIASLVVSCVATVGLCGYGIGGLLGAVGAILGHVARRRIRVSGAGGDGMALAGIIIGWIAAAVGVLAIVGIILLVTLSSSFDSTTV
jgi:hypothetical protein